MSEVPNSEKIKNRDTVADFAKGFTIILMLFDHIYGKGYFITSFHMPLFFILSGYFFKEYSTGDFLVKKVKRLIILYFEIGFIEVAASWLWALLYGHNMLSLSWFKSQCLDLILGESDGLHWFIIALLVTTILYWLIYKTFKYSKLIYGLLIVTVTIWGYLFSSALTHQIYEFDIGMICIGFFAAGHLYRLYQEKIDKYKKILLYISVVVWCIGIYNKGIVLALRIYPKFPLCIFSAICGTFVMMQVYGTLDKIPRFNRYIRWFGRNTLVVLCLGDIFRVSMWWTNGFPIENTLLSFAVQMVLVTIILYVWCKLKEVINSRKVKC